MPSHTSRLKHINQSYLEHQLFQEFIRNAISPLAMHAQYDCNFAWQGLVDRLQNVIQNYGRGYIAEWRGRVQQAKQMVQSLTELDQIHHLSAPQMDALSQSRAVLQANDKRKPNKWQIRARMKQLVDKDCSSKSFF